MELAAGYRGYTRPDRLADLPRAADRHGAAVLGGHHAAVFEKMAAEIKPGNPVESIRVAGEFFREKGVQSRPIHAHGIDLITDGPHVFTDGVHAEPFEQIFKPGMVFMAEPNPITAGRQFRHLPRPHLHRDRRPATNASINSPGNSSWCDALSCSRRGMLQRGMEPRAAGATFGSGRGSRSPVWPICRRLLKSCGSAPV